MKDGYCARSEVLTTLFMGFQVLWDMTRCATTQHHVSEDRKCQDDYHYQYS